MCVLGQQYFCYISTCQELQYEKITCSETLIIIVIQLCPTLCHPMDYSPPGPSVHGILQARILEWVAISFSRGYFRPRDQTCVSYIAGSFFTTYSRNTRTHIKLTGKLLCRDTFNKECLEKQLPPG